MNAWWTPFVGILLAAILAFLSARFWWQRNEAIRLAKEEGEKAGKLAEKNAEHMARTAAIEQELVALKTAVVPISAAFQAILIKELTHYHTPVVDKLLEKLGPPITLTLEEEIKLAAALEERTKDMNGAISESERDAAVMLPLVMKRVKAEILLISPEVQLVAVPPSASDSK